MRKNRIVVVTSLLAFAGLWVIGLTMAAHKPSDLSALPSGDWSLSSHPYMGEDLPNMPTAVASVTTDANKGLEISKVGIKNRSKSPTVQAIRLRWYLSNEAGDREAILLQGETPLIALPGGLAAGERRDIEFPVVAFAKVYGALSAGEQLKGAYRFDVGVSEVLFSDGQSWVWRKKDRLDIAEAISTGKVFKKVAYNMSTPSLEACAKQKCEFVAAEEGNPAHYKCSDSTEKEDCSNGTSACTNTICQGELE